MNCIVTFKSKESETSITLYSHFTCIYGRESGEGKSYFVDLLKDGIRTGEISVQVSENLPFVVADDLTITGVLESKRRLVVLIDELSMLRSSILKRVNESEHLFISVNRAMPLNLEYPLSGIYKLDYNPDDNTFEFLHMNDLKLLRKNDILSRFDSVITESSMNRSEHELLSVYLDNVIPSSGRDRVQNIIRLQGTKRLLVLVDLGAVGRAYGILAKRSSKNPNLRFYPYECFEHLLHCSKLVKTNRVVVDENSLSKYSYLSLEQYFEDLLERETAGTCIEYKHGAPLKEGFLDKDNFDLVFKSTVGILLWEYIRRFGN